MIKLLCLMGSLTFGTSAVMPILETNENNVLSSENYRDENKKQALDFIEYAINSLSNSITSTNVSSKLTFIKLAYPAVSQAYNFLNYVEHTPEIVNAKKLLLEGAEFIDLAARQGTSDRMNFYTGQAVRSLSSAIWNIGVNYNEQNKKQAQDFTSYAIGSLSNSVTTTNVSSKLKFIQLAYPAVSQAYDFLNYVEHTPEIVNAKKLLLKGAEFIDLAARQGTSDRMNFYTGQAIPILSSALKQIGLSNI
ncbi:hypothetical protein [Spiroplasma monobiae]|uniref:Uncharacterized protein n=1 Tax=Spiroplasma monobiae MQ-1 TaxID=1336748 RepID=A0A2K9LV19_SPISQ|nr:hypothetical protein [Spiroplasma monobiae]AUM62870.1 hypothetical protein SMONO_v1c06210 [Spiroplasma monobiae MQ-1]